MGRALVGANIHTMTTPGERATAIAWKDDTILAVGDDEHILQIAQEHDLPVTHLEGQAIVPGFVDAHMHFLHVGLKRTRPDLRGARSREEALQRVRDWIEHHPGHGPITGEGWDEADWEGQAPFTRDDLDEISPERPLVLRRICGHKAIANSAALPAIQARFDKGIDPQTGILLEEPSLYLNEVLPADPDSLQEAVRLACQVALRLGVTAIGDYEQAPMRQALLDAAAQGDLGVRVACSIYVQQLHGAIADGFRTGRVHPGPDGPSPFMRDGGLKVFLDGSLGGHTAHMREPYQGTDTHGLAVWTDDEVLDWFSTAHDAGIQIHAHAIGDAAIDQGLWGLRQVHDHPRRHDTRATADPRWPTFHDARHRFEHFEIAHDEHIRTCKDLGIVAACQPNFVGAWSAKGGMYEARIGPVFRLNNRYATFSREGLEFCFSSDGMPFGPIYGLHAAMHHPIEEERSSPEDAVYRYTKAAAQAMHWDDIGSLAPGHKADMIILDRPALDDEPKEWVFDEVIVAGQTACCNQTPFVSDDDVGSDDLMTMRT